MTRHGERYVGEIDIACTSSLFDVTFNFLSTPIRIITILIALERYLCKPAMYFIPLKHKINDYNTLQPVYVSHVLLEFLEPGVCAFILNTPGADRHELERQ